MKNKEVLKTVLIFIILFSTFIILLTLISMFPSKLISKNVEKSLEVLKKEGNFPKIKYALNYRLDNYTDALMINTAYSIDSREPLTSALLARRNYQCNRKEKLALIEIDSENTIQNLEHTLREENTEYCEYSRYWHGYLVFLRPLLLFMDYAKIRILLILVINILLIITCYYIWKKINLKYAFAFFISMILAASIHLIGLSLQYSSVFIISLCSTLYILLKQDKINIYILFFITGEITCFMDLLTCPIITFGIPLIIYIALNENKDLKDIVKIIIKLGIYWGLGYCAIWFSKWLITDSIYKTNTIESAINKIKGYSGMDGGININISIIDSFIANIEYIFPIISILIITIILTIPNIFIENRKMLLKNLPYIIIAIIPFVWYAVTKKHAYIHARFTYKNLVVTTICLSIVALNSLQYMVKQLNKTTNTRSTK